MDELKSIIEQIVSMGGLGLAALALVIVYIVVGKKKTNGTTSESNKRLIDELFKQQEELKDNHLHEIGDRLDRLETTVGKLCERVAVVETKLSK